MEHAVYLCSWNRDENGYTLWVISRPNLRGFGLTYEEAEERFIEKIQSAGGAMHAVLEFQPPLPKNALEAKYGNPEILLIGGDDRFETEPRGPSPYMHPEMVENKLREIDTYFQSPLCRKCKNTPGRRNEKPLNLTYAPGQYDGAFGSIGPWGHVTLQIVSQEFLDLLTVEERRRLEFRRAVREGRTRKVFFELIGPAGPPFVAVRDLPINGWRCAQCNHRTWGYFLEGCLIHSFVARADLDSTVEGVFTVGAEPEIHLAVTADRWKELVGKKGTRGFHSRPIGVVRDDEVIRVPDLKTHEPEPD